MGLNNMADKQDSAAAPPPASQGNGGTPQTTLGERLRELRVEKGLSVAEAASQLYLRAEAIEALERNDFNALPTETYVRGYLRNYAQLLEVPAESLLGLYAAKDKAHPPPAPAAPSAETETPPEPAAAEPAAAPRPVKVIGAPETPAPPVAKLPSDSPLTLVSYLVVFSAAMLLFVSWRTGSMPGWDNDDTRLLQGLPYEVRVVKHPEGPSYRTLNAKDLPNTRLEPGPGAKAAPFERVDEIRAGGGPDKIRISLLYDSWIEVFDANNEKLYYNLAGAGQVLALSGVAPFSVLIGFSPGVVVEFNGDVFDHSPHSSGVGIARFTLGE